MEIKHTPGPWKERISYSEHGEHFYGIINEGHDYVVGEGGVTSEGNRALILAAPELLAVAKTLLALIEEGCLISPEGRAANRLYDAISKATGEPS